MAIVAGCLASLWARPIGAEWLVLAGLTLLSGSFTIKVPTLPARISVSETFVFTSVLLFGPAAGTITVALEALVAALGVSRAKQEPLRTLFNVSAASLSIWVAGHLFYFLADAPAPIPQGQPLPQLVLPLAALTLSYFLLNSVLVALALSYERTAPAYQIWRRNFLWLSVNYFGGASVAALLVSYTGAIDLTALGIIVPLLVISYLTFKTSLGRIEDAARHVEQVDRMYLSTIESLATAIDAKDQVTHGHIRRVQRFALGLADALGVKNGGQQKALEAAALLHDMGKLAVPEHILNKPGRLTPGEFERMKLHAAVGAEILTSVAFPYPVVPIVRHHHENWDGTGYPDGLRGTQIPLGARILSVVDCYDALTSDRPYRRKLSDVEATDILMQRRGQMYDPLIVDTFIAVKSGLLRAVNLDQPTVTQPTPKGVRHPRGRLSLDMTAHYEGLVEACVTALSSIDSATGAAATLLLVRDDRNDRLVPVCSSGASPAVRLQEVQLGERVSGWVAANGRSLLNADASLEIDEKEWTARRFSKCIAVPVRASGEIVGVLVSFQSDPRGFSEHDLGFVESIASQLAAPPLSLVLRELSDLSSKSQSYDGVVVH
ncbi:MAG: HD domain-containing phosphohydrolase [Vicinamibacterales bacterium]